jgi:hypothetical protein
VASSRAWVAAAMAFLVAAVLVISSVAAIPPTQQSGHGAASSHPPSCAQSPNCGGGGALSGGSVFVASADGGTLSGLERVPTLGRLVVSDSGDLPAGVPAPLFHPPKGSWI